MTKSTSSRLLLALFIALSVSACDSLTSTGTQKAKSQMANSTAVADDEVVALVNGQPISKNVFEIYLKQRTQRQPLTGSPDEMQTLLNEFIDMDLMYQDALDKGIGDRPDISGVLELQKMNILVRTHLTEYSAENPVSEEAQKAAYDEQIAAQSPKEYKARHILSKTEEDAREMISQLDGGADFAQLAKDNSTGPSAKQGGDLGWFSPDRMVEAFSNAAMTLEKGSYTKDPVETQFGWHVILLEDQRETTPPAFEQAKKQIQMALQRKQLEDYIKSLREAARIEIKADPAFERATEPAAEAADSQPNTQPTE